MTDKTFAVAGVSKLNNKFRARFAKDMMRVKVLDKGGHTDINLVELPTAMTKADAAGYLIDTGFDAGNADIRAALYAEIDRVAGVKPAAAAPAAAVEAEEELQTVAVDDVITAEEAHEMAAFAEGDDTALDRLDELVERAHEIAAEMKPAAVRGPGGRFVKQETAGSAAFAAWAEAANAEEEADIEF